MRSDKKQLILDNHHQTTELTPSGELFVLEPFSSEFNDDGNVQYWIDVTLWTRRQLFEWLGY